jgi:aerobic carbon-monoxide dehydrogenase small subunit
LNRAGDPVNPRKIHCTLDVNHVAHDVLVHADDTLLDLLREQLALCGTKRGCNHGVCGACNVLVDGVLVRACLTLAVDVGDRPVITIEGTSDGSAHSKIQQALVAAGAIQCGFCTPGFVMALTALFAREPHPDRDTIRNALSGNLCRCSGYVKILEAAERLAEVAP